MQIHHSTGPNSCIFVHSDVNSLSHTMPPLLCIQDARSTVFQAMSNSSSYLPSDNSGDRYKPLGCLDNSAPFVPPRRNPSELDRFRRSLPIYESQEDILQLVRANRVVLVVGETGSGKTTQVGLFDRRATTGQIDMKAGSVWPLFVLQIPQMLLDDCSMNIEPCRILCTQPRWLAVLVVAERVAKERGESVGQTVGYHIRLECR